MTLRKLCEAVWWALVRLDGRRHAWLDIRVWIDRRYSRTDELRVSA